MLIPSRYSAEVNLLCLMQIVSRFLSFNTWGHSASYFYNIFVQQKRFDTFNIHLNHTAGAPRFRMLSPVVAYSLCLFLLVMVSFYCNVTDRMATIFDRRDFDYKIYMAVLIFYSACSIFLPIIMALDTKTFVHYTREWALFQVGCILNVWTQEVMSCWLYSFICYKWQCI